MTNLASQLRHISSEKLSFWDFRQYINDYLGDPKAYGIADMPEYLEALREAKEDFVAAYSQYEMAFVPTNITSDLNAHHIMLSRIISDLNRLESQILPTPVKEALAMIAANLHDADYELTMVIGSIS